ncbi:RagB/SusD family nutrient uptake outer membrane protein [Pedobacter insulae]|uniref:SusD family protein n=1 Tax=Pedobacter insulae TaxID=414048 RepID=A0A1I3AM40_9SPHI|nr:RagB/SusD family nutrient uptake outer membrane protein [Pedobacter insulae]SFH51083.1 SusD family protein [Pedobacter insulae]
MKNISYLLLFSGFFLLSSCEKYFDEKTDISLVVPQTLDDFQAILDAKPRGMNSSALAGFLSSDDLFLGPAILARLNYREVSAYFWRKDFYLPDEVGSDWNNAYRKVFHANLVLDGLKGYKTRSVAEENRAKILEASAKFYRALGHFESLSYFAEYYNSTNSMQLGVPIRLTSDLNQKAKRSTQKDSYQQIIDDLKFGLNILPDKPEVPTRPSAWAAHALLSRIYLYMGDYEAAYIHANATLEIDDVLMDYAKLNSNLTYSFQIFNSEVIHYGELISGRYAYDASTFVNPEIVRLYSKDDLRLFYFFKNSSVDSLKNFRGNYTGDYYIFGGLAINEVLLNRAEAAVRIGQNDRALESVNYLLANRINPASFQPYVGVKDNDLLNIIMLERRKELVFRGIRWLDLKRYNNDPSTAITLFRNYNVENSTLPPRDIRYVIPIPPKEIALNPMQQNPR